MIGALPLVRGLDRDDLPKYVGLGDCALFEAWFAKEIENKYKDAGSEVRRRYEKDVAPLIGKREPSRIAESDIVAVIDAVAGRGAKRMAGLLLADLRQMFKFAVRRKIATYNPTDELDKGDWSGESVERKRNLAEKEILLLRKQLPDAKLIPETECAIWILLGTLCRIGELSQSRWDQVIGDELMLSVELTKTKEPHTVVLSPFVRKQLKRLKSLNPQSEWLFPAKHNGGAVDRKSITKQITHRQRGKLVKGRSPAVTSLRLPPRVRIVVAPIESMNPGAMMRGRGGPIRKGIQGTCGGATAAAGERDAGRTGTRVGRWGGDAGAVAERSAGRAQG